MLGMFSFLVVLLRAAILCFQTIAVGGILFFLLVARKDDLRREELLRPGWKLIRGSALALAISQLLFVVANSFVLTYSADISLREALGANFVYAGMLAFVAGLLLAFWPEGLRQRVSPIALVPAAVILAASVMTSHSASRMEDRAVLVLLTAVHFLATASWIGGLPFLLLAMKCVTDSETRTRISRNFSRLAQVSVSLLFAAGLAMSFWYVGSWDAIYGTAYGVMVSTKVVFFGCLLLLGAANYFILRGVGPVSTSGAKSLARFGEVEVGIGLTVILVAASLTSLPPGADLTQDRVTLHEIATRFAPRMPRFSSPNAKELSKTTKEIIAQGEAEGQKIPAAFIPGQFASSTNGPADIAWSEYNHSWAGIIVFLMGVLALLSRSRYFPWAKNWPLMFLGLAVFLFLRADPENWPLGPNGFWESFAVTDVLQHRLAVLLIIIFAAFQWMVETNRLKSHAAALVFPGVCALGGVVLLTHTHALSNVKEEMLVELSHTPLAIFGILAGWSRWLELRLPQENQIRKVLAWVWPVCFIIIGMILMNYHES
jgi:copper resistance protein D